MSTSDIYTTDWHELPWSEWQPLDPNAGALSTLSTEPGLYRIRHRSRDGLQYVGETGRSTRGRVRSLARGTYADEMPFRDPHTAAPCLWALRDRHGPELKVSWVTPAIAEDDQHRKGLEAALIATHRRAFEQSPTANFGRMIPDYRQSSYRSDGVVGGPLPAGETESNANPGIRPPSWTNWTDVTALDWMGLSWSKPRPLTDRLEIATPETGVYRIWYPGSPRLLAYIGETSVFTSRLRRHQLTFGGEAVVSVAGESSLDATHKRRELETDLVGAHYLACDAPPRAQFGQSENVPLD